MPRRALKAGTLLRTPSWGRSPRSGEPTLGEAITCPRGIIGLLPSTLPAGAYIREERLMEDGENGGPLQVDGTGGFRTPYPSSFSSFRKRLPALPPSVYDTPPNSADTLLPTFCSTHALASSGCAPS